MELKDLVPIPTSIDSLSVLSSLLNSSLQTPGVNSLQQPLLVPWSGQAPNAGFPVTAMPMLNQSIISPLTASLSPPKDTLILLPLSPGSSQSMPTTSDLSTSPISCPTFQPMPMTSIGHVSSAHNSFSNPLAVKQVCSLPILSQPSLPQSLSTVLLNGANSSVSYEDKAVNTCHHSTGSSGAENTIARLKTPVVNFDEGKERLSWKKQRRSSHPLNGTDATIFNKSNNNHSIINISSSPGGRDRNGLSVNQEAGIPEPQNMTCVREIQQSQLDSDNINKIVSSLPPGWRVVGLTSLNSYLPAVSENNHSSFPSTTLPVIQTQSSAPHHRSSPPDVVSVDLNVSSALPVVSSPVAIDTVNANVSNIDKCSIHLCDTPSNRLITVKKEMPDPGEHAGSSWDSSASSNEIESRSNDLKISASALLSSMKAEPDAMILPASEGKSKIVPLGNEESQWTVVGVTSLPLTPLCPSEPIPLDNLPNLSPLITVPSSTSTFSSHHQVDTPEKAISTSTTTILNVPLPKISQPIRPISSDAAANPLQKPLSLGLNHQIESSKQLALLKNSEWTVVGVTVSPSLVKTQNTYSTAGTQQLIHRDKLPLSDFNLISLETLKSQLHSNKSNSQQGHTNFSDIIKNLSALDHHGKDKPPGAVDVPQSAVNNEWKLVGITQLGGEQPDVKLPENCQTSNVCPVVSSVNTVPTSTSSISQGIVSCSSVTDSSLPFNPFNSILDSLFKSSNINMPEKSPMLSVSESDPQQSNLMQYINGQLLLQQDQHQQQQQENGNSLPIVPPQILNSNSLGNVNALNQFQNLLGINTSEDESHSHHESELKSEAAILNPHVNLMSCPEEPKCSNFGSNSSANSKSSLSRLQNSKFRRSKFQCIERCIGKPDCVSRKAKDMCVRCMKKHTVSHLLKIKRMKDTDDSGCEEDKGDNFECVGQNFKIVKRLSDKILKRLTTRVDRDGRTRPLHSYAGNRKMFSRTVCGSKNSSLERISLRSGTQVPVSNYKSDSNEDAVQTCAALESRVKIENEGLEENCAFFKNETRSAARKRKLKVPRKMIADLDYHPFDSSSDSN